MKIHGKPVKEIWRVRIITVSAVFAAAATALFVLMFAGCSMDQPLLTITQDDIISPVLKSLETADRSTIKLTFSKPVNPVSAEISANIPDDYQEQAEPIRLEWQCNGNEVMFTTDTPLEIGAKYNISGVVKDAKANSLTFLMPFTGYNDHTPRLLISEVRTEYAKPKTEFIELYVQEEGNLAGIRLSSASDGENKAYEFPAAEVQSGEFIVLHMRKLEEGCINEIEDITLSGGTESSSAARDFWVENIDAMLPKTDVILLEKHKGGPVLDALCIREEKHAAWPKESLEKAAQKAFEQGAWVSGAGSEGAVISDKTTVTRTLSRQGYIDNQGIPAGNKNWIIVNTGQSTPGTPNSTYPYSGA